MRSENKTRVKEVMSAVLAFCAIIGLGIVMSKGNVEASTSKPVVPLTLHLQVLASCPGGAFHCVGASWGVPATDATHGAPTGYNLYRATVSGGCSNTAAASCTKIPVAGGTTASFVDSPLAPSTTYFYVLTASNGNESAPTTEQSATTGADPAPNTPTNFQVIGK